MSADADFPSNGVPLPSTLVVMGGEERRRYARIALRRPISISGRSVGYITGEIVNISRRGLLLLSPVPLERGTVLRFKALWPPSRLCTAEGEVVRVQKDQHGISLGQASEAFEHLVAALEFCEAEELSEIWGALISCAVEIRAADGASPPDLKARLAGR